MNKKDEVYDYIVGALISARYRFGQRLLVKELAAETGVSRQPIMTALNRLAADGFVRIIPQVGCEVVQPAPAAIADFYLMFARMEGLLSELAATRRTDRQLRELTALQQQIVAFEHDHHDSAQDYASLNREFHQIIHVMADSPLLDEKQRSNFNMSDFFITQSVGFGAFMSNAVQEHHEIIGAIADRSPKRARKVAEAHITAVADAVLSGIHRQKGETDPNPKAPPQRLRRAAEATA